MVEDNVIINGLCKRVDAEIGDGTTAGKLRNFEAMVLSETLKNKKRMSNSARRYVMIAACVLALLIPAGLFWVHIESDSPLQFEVDNQTLGSPTNMALHTGKIDTQKIRFRNGSTIELKNNTNAVLQKATQRGVVVQLAQGELFLDVEGKESDTWEVDTGDYRVSVLGTRFYVKWHKRGKVLDVRVLKGTVLVEGNFVGKVGIAVSEDTHLRLDTQTGFSAMNNMSSVYYDANSPSLLRNENDILSAWNERHGLHQKNADYFVPGKINIDGLNNSLPGAAPGENSFSPGKWTRTGESLRPHLSRDTNALQTSEKGHKHAVPNTVSGTGRRNWQVLLAHGDLEGAISAAESAGFSGVIEKATLGQLWRLMNAARKSGRDALAEQTLLTCRRRFDQSNKARLAAYVLGKVNYYGKNDSEAATKWFETYLQEAPSGPLAEEALGRLIAIQEERGKANQAKTLAVKYLKLYPTGSFAQVCRELIGD